jgi:hypothetical protein
MANLSNTQARAIELATVTRRLRLLLVYKSG